MNSFVQDNQVVAAMGQAYVYADYVHGVVNGIQKQLNCANCVIIGSFWMIPWVQGNQVVKYTYESAINTSVPPTADSIKILRIKDMNDNTDYDLAIANTDNVAISSPPNQFAYLCDGSGGTLPVMPTVKIPFPIIQFPPTSVSGSNNIFTIPFPANPNGLLYSIPAPWFNGLAGTPAYAPGGITTPAQFVTWANSNWNGYGTWASSGTIVTLTSAMTNVKNMGMQVALQLANFCFNLTPFSTPSLVNGIQFGTGPIVAVPAFQLTNDPNVLQAALSRVMSAQSTTFSQTVSHKLGVQTALATPQLYNGAVSVVAAGAGTC